MSRNSWNSKGKKMCFHGNGQLQRVLLESVLVLTSQISKGFHIQYRVFYKPNIVDALNCAYASYLLLSDS